MPPFYLLEERHTLASALRPALEALARDDEFVHCTLIHPLDQHIEVMAPSEAILRRALLTVKEQIREARRVLDGVPAPASAPPIP